MNRHIRQHALDDRLHKQGLTELDALLSIIIGGLQGSLSDAQSLRTDART